jgi:energy-coupling factor transporter transmembrane protein EcfT
MRFIPGVLGEWTTIRDAQKSRGAAVVYGGFIFTRKFWVLIKDVVTIAIPLFTGVLRISGQVSAAMESKAFDVEGKSRTKYYEFPMKQFDWVFLTISIIIGAALLYLRFFGGIGWI